MRSGTRNQRSRNLLFEVVAEAIGSGEPEDVPGALASNRDRVLSRLVELYADWNCPIPKSKAVGEFVPSWNLDHHDYSIPMGLGPYFVARAILYSHRVGVVNELALHMVPNESGLPMGGFGFQEALQRVLLFGHFEETGLLFYLPPGPSPKHEEVLAIERSDDDLAEFFREYLAPSGRYITVDDWSSSTGDAWLARNAASLHLGLGLASVEAALIWQRSNAAYTDLHIPPIPIYANAMEWMVRRDGTGLLRRNASSADGDGLNALWRLPVPSNEAYAKLTIGDVMSLREDAVFDRWRAVMKSSLEAYSVGGALENDASAVKAFIAELDARRSETLKGIQDLTVYRKMAGAAGVFGVTAGVSAGVTLAFQQDPLVGTLASLAAGAVVATPPLIRALKRSGRTTQQGEALDAHFELFGVG